MSAIGCHQLLVPHEINHWTRTRVPFHLLPLGSYMSRCSRVQSPLELFETLILPTKSGLNIQGSPQSHAVAVAEAEGARYAAARENIRHLAQQHKTIVTAVME